MQLDSSHPRPPLSGAASRIRDEAQLFATAALFLIGAAPENLAVDSIDGMTYAALLAGLRISPTAGCVDWRERRPETTAAFTYAGRHRDRRLRKSVARLAKAEIVDAA